MLQSMESQRVGHGLATEQQQNRWCFPPGKGGMLSQTYLCCTESGLCCSLSQTHPTPGFTDLEGRGQDCPFSKACVCLAAQSCPTLCDPLNRRLPGCSVHESLQTRILEWVAISLLQRIFLTQGSKLLCLLHCRQILYPLGYQGSPFSKVQHLRIGETLKFQALQASSHFLSLWRSFPVHLQKEQALICCCLATMQNLLYPRNLPQPSCPSPDLQKDQACNRSRFYALNIRGAYSASCSALCPVAATTHP